MNILYQRQKMHTLPGLCRLGGSDSESNSSSSNSTENRDMRVVGGNDSVNLSANDSTLSVVTTDHGSVDKSFQLADKALSLSTKAIGDSATSALQATQSMYEGALGSINKAYENSTTPENNQLKIAGFVVVGIAAVSLFMKAKS